MNNMIATWGNPNSGKTTTAIKLAKKLSSDNKNVIVVFCDDSVPTTLTVVPDIDSKERSLGNILSSPQITQEIILENCITLKDNKHLSFLGYKQYDNIFTYADYDRERAIDFMILLKHLADYIIVDCNSCFENNILSAVALEMADIVLRHISCDLKSVSFFDSHLNLLADKRFKINDHVRILSNVKEYQSKPPMIQRFGGVKNILSYAYEIEEQFLSGKLLADVISKRGRVYDESITDILKYINSEDERVKEIVDTKKSKKAVLSKIKFKKPNFRKIINIKFKKGDKKMRGKTNG